MGESPPAAGPGAVGAELALIKDDDANPPLPKPFRRSLHRSDAGLGRRLGDGLEGAPDRKPPNLSLTSPANGSVTSDNTPTLAGKAGRSAGDRRAISVRVYLGVKAAGRAQRVLMARRTQSSWAVTLRQR